MFAEMVRFNTVSDVPMFLPKLDHNAITRRQVASVRAAGSSLYVNPLDIVLFNTHLSSSTAPRIVRQLTGQRTRLIVTHH